MRDIRVIIDADTACEGDDPFAIVHALLSPELDICAVCAEHYINYVLLGAVSPHSEEKSFQENRKFVRLAGRSGIPILHGAKFVYAVHVSFRKRLATGGLAGCRTPFE